MVRLRQCSMAAGLAPPCPSRPDYRATRAPIAAGGGIAGALLGLLVDLRGPQTAIRLIGWLDSVLSVVSLLR